MENEFFKFIYRENIKIVLENPKRMLFVILIFIFGLSLIFIKRTKENNEEFLTRIQTDQLKGIAILAVVLGHFSWSVLENKEQLSLLTHWGYISVGIFLSLSAYGLYFSTKKNKLNNYFKRRIEKVYIPYLIITIIWLILDFILLKYNHDIYSTFLMLVGINWSYSWKNEVDFNMWYITFLFLWYIIYYFILKLNVDNKIKQIILYFISIFIIILASYFNFPNTWGINAFNFPIGFTIAINIDSINRYLKTKNKFHILSLSVTFLVLYFMTKFIKISTEDLFLQNFSNSLSAIFMLCFLSLLVYISFCLKLFSKFLEFIGKVSFEIYLLHGPLMYRYDFILWRGEIEITLIVYFVLLILLAYITHKFLNLLKLDGWRTICSEN